MTSSVRIALIGALTPIAGAALITGGTAIYWPDIPFLGVFGRIFESLAPYLLVLGVGLCAVIALLGARRLAAVFCVLACAMAGTIAFQHFSYAQPLTPNARTDLTLLWYNVFSRTRVDHARIAQALIDSPADIILLSEATPLQDQTETLFAAFPYHLGCEAKHCNFLVLSRIALTHPTLRLIEAQPPDRLAATQLELAGHEPLSVMGIHMVKPWYYGPTEHDRWYAQDTLRKIAGPLVVVGDFNAAPWSRRLKEFFRKFGLAPMPFPVPTWPAKAGRFGVPIDHVLVSGGARLVSITPWGAGLGSNHRGLLVGISVPAKADAGTP